MNCPDVLAHGTCSDVNCRFNHNILTCEHCNLVFITKEEEDFHLTTDKHRNRVIGTAFVRHCSLCSLNISGGERVWNDHVNGRRHRANALAKGVSPQIEPQGPTATPKAEFCELCHCLIENRHWQSHLRGNKHKTREMYTRYRSAVEDAETDKNGISVTGQFDFEFVDPPVAAEGVRNIATITTSIPFSRVRVLEARLASAQGARLVVPA